MKDVALSSLTKREWEVAQLVTNGLSNKQIGCRLHITERTTIFHVSNILQKLQASSRSEIAVIVSNYQLLQKL